MAAIGFANNCSISNSWTLETLNLLAEDHPPTGRQRQRSGEGGLDYQASSTVSPALCLCLSWVDGPLQGGGLMSRESKSLEMLQFIGKVNGSCVSFAVDLAWPCADIKTLLNGLLLLLLFIIRNNE